MTPTTGNSEREELREQLAAIEHQRWADWQKWLHSKLTKREEYYGLDRSDYDRWERQINTPYAELTKDEQLSDLQQVDRYWPLIEAYTNARVAVTRSDLAWCLGNLRGLGFPAEHLEQQHGFKAAQQAGKETGNGLAETD